MNDPDPPRLRLARAVCGLLPPLLSQRVRTLIYPRSRAVRDRRRFMVRSVTGSNFEGKTDDYHAYPFGVHGFYEWRNVAVAAALCRPGDSIIEIGSNVGTETICFADLVGPTGHVYAFEPVPSNLASLTRIRDRNGLGQLLVSPYAIGDGEGEVCFRLPPEAMSGIGYVTAGPPRDEPGSIRVRRVSLDGIAATIARPVRMVYADAEGSEVAILSGGRTLIRDDRPALVLEASDRNLRRQGTTVAELRETIRSLDYEIWVIGRAGLSPLADTACAVKSDWLALPAERAAELAVAASHAILRCGVLPPRLGLGRLMMRQCPTDS